MFSLLYTGVVLFLLLIILAALMLWRWRVHKHPLPPAARNVLNLTLRRRKEADNELYRADPQTGTNVVANGQQTHPTVIK